MPFFSIIIPVYNVAPYLRECLDSVMAQTFGDWEAICVDDGSTDGSGAILDEYAAKDNRFKVIHQPNAGVSAARNAALDVAIGEYVTFLDGDDAYKPSWMDSFRKLINETGAELVRLRKKTWDGCLDTSDANGDCSYKVYSTKKEIADWGYLIYSEEGWSWLNAIKRSTLNEAPCIRFPIGMSFMEDNIFMLKVLPLINNACEGTIMGYLYRQRVSSVCGGKRSANMVARLFDEASSLYVSMPEEYRKCLSGMLWRSVLDWRGHRDRNETGGNVVVRACVVRAVEDSVFHLSAIPKRWQPGFSTLLSLRSFVALDLLLCAQKVWGNFRSLFV